MVTASQPKRKSSFSPFRKSPSNEETKAAPQSTEDYDAARQSLADLDSKSTDSRPFDSLGFNQDSSCIALGTKDGFKVFMSNPLKCYFERRELGQIKIAELLFRNQIVALVGGSDNELIPSTKVSIWDDYLLKKIDEIKLGQKVLAVKMRKDKIVVVMRRKVHMYNLSDLEFFGALDTADNPNGVVALNSMTETFILAVLSEHSANTAFI